MAICDVLCDSCGNGTLSRRQAGAWGITLSAHWQRLWGRCRRQRARAPHCLSGRKMRSLLLIVWLVSPLGSAYTYIHTYVCIVQNASSLFLLFDFFALFHINLQQWESLPVTYCWVCVEKIGLLSYCFVYVYMRRPANILRMRFEKFVGGCSVTEGEQLADNVYDLLLFVPIFVTIFCKRKSHSAQRSSQ